MGYYFDELTKYNFQKINNNKHLLSSDELDLYIMLNEDKGLENLIINPVFKTKDPERLDKIFTKFVNALPDIVSSIIIDPNEIEDLDEDDIKDRLHDYINSFDRKITVKVETKLDELDLNNFLSSLYSETGKETKIIELITNDISSNLFNVSYFRHLLNYEFIFLNDGEFVYSEIPQVDKKVFNIIDDNGFIEEKEQKYIRKIITVGNNLSEYFSNNITNEILGDIKHLSQEFPDFDIEFNNLTRSIGLRLQLHDKSKDNKPNVDIIYEYKGDIEFLYTLEDKFNKLYEKYLQGYKLYKPLKEVLPYEYKIEFKYELYNDQLLNIIQKIYDENKDEYLEHIENEELNIFKYKGNGDYVLEQYLSTYNIDFQTSIEDWSVNPVEIYLDFEDLDYLYHEWFEKIVVNTFGDQYINKIILDDRFKVYKEDDKLVYEFQHKNGNIDNNYLKHLPFMINQIINNEEMLMETYDYLTFRVKNHDNNVSYDIIFDREGRITKLDGNFFDYINIARYIKIC